MFPAQRSRVNADIMAGTAICLIGTSPQRTVVLIPAGKITMAISP
jgi:hypothetical protein